MGEEFYTERGYQAPTEDFTGQDWGIDAVKSCMDFFVTRTWPEWHQQAACSGMEQVVFFGHEELPGKQRHRPTLNVREVREAKQICGSCPVRWECLEHAINNHEEFGIWGGTTGRERNRLLRAKGIAEVKQLMLDVGF